MVRKQKSVRQEDASKSIVMDWKDEVSCTDVVSLY